MFATCYILSFFLTFLPVVVRYSLFVSLSVLHFCTGGVFAVFPSPFRHSGCIVHLSIALHCTALYCIVFHCIVHLSSSPICSPPLIGRGGLPRNFSFTRFCRFAMGRRSPGGCFGAGTDFLSHLFFNICMVEFAFLCFELYCKTSHFLGPVCL